MQDCQGRKVDLGWWVRMPWPSMLEAPRRVEMRDGDMVVVVVVEEGMVARWSCAVVDWSEMPMVCMLVGMWVEVRGSRWFWYG